jgi:hypothetical protein
MSAVTWFPRRAGTAEPVPPKGTSYIVSVKRKSRDFPEFSARKVKFFEN